MNSQLKPRPTRQASDLSQARGIVNCGKVSVTMEETHHIWDKVLKQGNWKEKPRDSCHFLIFH